MNDKAAMCTSVPGSVKVVCASPATFASSMKNSSETLLTAAKSGISGLFLCSKCSFTTNDRKKLMSHRRIHTGEKSFQCSECSARFTRKYYLKCHLIQKHNNHSLSAGSRVHQFPRYCPYIGCTFVTRNQTSLTIHKKIHQAPRPFYCVECPTVSYAQRRSLVQHIAKKHNSDWSLIGRDTPPVRNLMQSDASKVKIQSQVRTVRPSDDVKDGEQISIKMDMPKESLEMNESTDIKRAEGAVEKIAEQCGSDNSAPSENESSMDAPISSVYRCELCSYQCANFTSLYAHKRKNHLRTSGRKRKSAAKRVAKTNPLQKLQRCSSTLPGDSQRSRLLQRSGESESQTSCHAPPAVQRVSNGPEIVPSVITKQHVPMPIQASFSCAFCNFVTNIHESLEIHIEQSHNTPCASNSNSSSCHTTRRESALLTSPSTPVKKPSWGHNFPFLSTASVKSDPLPFNEGFCNGVSTPVNAAKEKEAEFQTADITLQDCVEHMQMANSALLRFCRLKEERLTELRKNVRTLLQLVFPSHSAVAGDLPLESIDAYLKQVLNCYSEPSPVSTSTPASMNENASS